MRGETARRPMEVNELIRINGFGGRSASEIAKHDQTMEELESIQAKEGPLLIMHSWSGSDAGFTGPAVKQPSYVEIKGALGVLDSTLIKIAKLFVTFVNVYLTNGNGQTVFRSKGGAFEYDAFKTG